MLHRSRRECEINSEKFFWHSVLLPGTYVWCKQKEVHHDLERTLREPRPKNSVKFVESFEKHLLVSDHLLVLEIGRGIPLARVHRNPRDAACISRQNRTWIAGIHYIRLKLLHQGRRILIRLQLAALACSGRCNRSRKRGHRNYFSNTCSQLLRVSNLLPTCISLAWIQSLCTWTSSHKTM